MNQKVLAALLGGISSVEAWGEDPKQPLYALNVDSTMITVFGYSCGSWIAHQMGTIFSSTIKGQTLACGGIAFDGYDDIQTAYDRVDGYSSAGTIDKTSNLDGNTIYIFSGENDAVIPPSNQRQQETFYDNYSANTTFISDADMGHYFNDDTFQNGLDYHYGSLVDNYGGLSSFSDLGGSWQDYGTLLQFDQDEFAPSPIDRDASGIADRGYLYYPTACVGSDKNCKLAIAFTGGGGNATDIMETGILETAAANEIVLLFPQQETATRPCFDVEGWSGDDYDTKTGIQSAAFESMMNRLMEAQDSTTYDYDAPSLSIGGFWDWLFGWLFFWNWGIFGK